MNRQIIFVVTLCFIIKKCNSIADNTSVEYIKVPGEHTVVEDSETFPYVAAILKKSKYISAGALIDESWVLTAADSLFMVRESIRILRVRLGSANYKKGGWLTPIKYIQIHPRFDDSKPQYDVALIRLSEPMTLNPGLNPIKLQRKPRTITARHFIVAAWLSSLQLQSASLTKLPSPELTPTHRHLTVSHLHPMDVEDCMYQLEVMGSNRTGTVMCLDLPAGANPCKRDAGAPVSLNGVLWGVVSSWKSEDCDLDRGPSSIFVGLVSSIEISSWIHSTVHGHRWSQKHSVDYRDNFV